MVYDQHYGGVIWTNHVLERLRDRKLSQEAVLQTFKYPETQTHGKQAGTMEYRKKFDSSTVTVIAKQNEKSEWLILSTWVDPPFPGTNDAIKREKFLAYRNAYKNASFWGRIWLDIKSMFGF